MENIINNIIIEQSHSYEHLKFIFFSIQKELSDAGLVITYQSRLKSEKSLLAKIITGKDISDVIGFRIITMWTKHLDHILNIIRTKFNVIRENIIEKQRIIYLYCKLDNDIVFEIQLTTFTLYSCFEANKFPSDDIINKYHNLQDIIDNNLIV